MADSDGNLIEWLGAAPDPAALGGKGASLDRLIRIGFRVPPGFCLTTAAFRAQRAVLDVRASRPVGAEEGDVPAWVADLLAAPLVPAVAETVGAALDRLAGELEGAGIFGPRFAVRSSAIGEDGSAASYAGLHETELDLAADDVPGAIARCWASLWSGPAVAYRRRRGISMEEAAMAVVVQALVPADASAVAFTRHPVTGRDDQLVATAVRGLGDAMVAGTVTPDTYVVDKSTRSIVELEPGEDHRGVALDAGALRDLVEMALAVERGFGAAVDIEAAMAGGTWWLLQARPITTGAPVTGGHVA